MQCRVIYFPAPCMSLTEYSWKSFDGLDLYALQWPSERPEAVIAFVHGHGDHCRRYDDWFSQLCSRNFSVLTFDYRGHGRSQGKRGVIRRFDDLVMDVKVLVGQARSLYPGIPVVLYGHSLGGTVVLSYILRSVSKPDLALVTSPWLLLHNHPGIFLSALIKIAGRVIPSVTFETGLHSSDFSSVDGFGENSEKDPYLHNRISPGLFLEVEREAKWILSHLNEVNIPLLLMQGKADLIMDVNGMHKTVEHLPGQVSYIEWENAGHQLHNSDQSSGVMNFIVDWIKQRI